MRELLVIPHGEPMCDVLGIVGGPRGCTGLSPTGRWQAERLGARLRREADAAGDRQVLHASRRLRARQTAEIVAGSLGVTLSLVTDLGERDLGPHADGRSRRAVGDDPPGAEEWPDYVTRTAKALDGLTREHRWGRLIVIAHPDTVRAAYYRFLGIPAHQHIAMDFATGYTSVTSWHSDGERWSLMTHNDSSHL